MYPTTPAGDDTTWKQAVPLWGGWRTDGSVSAFLKQSH